MRDLVLGEDRIHSLNLDASQIGAKKLAINLDSEIGGGKISAAITFSETRSSLNSEMHLLAEKVDAAALNKYATLPEGFLHGEIERNSRPYGPCSV